MTFLFAFKRFYVTIIIVSGTNNKYKYFWEDISWNYYKGKHLLLWALRTKEVLHGELLALCIMQVQKLIFTYAGERLERNVRELADTLEGQESLVLPCDVTNDEELTACFETIKQEVGTIHGVAHCIAFCKS